MLFVTEYPVWRGLRVEVYLHWGAEVIDVVKRGDQLFVVALSDRSAPMHPRLFTAGVGTYDDLSIIAGDAYTPRYITSFIDSHGYTTEYFFELVPKQAKGY